MQAKSDSESFDEDKQKILNVQREVEVEQLREKLKILKAEMKTNEQNMNHHVSKIDHNLQFSRDSNMKLKSDYDIMTDKFERHMKSSHNSILQLQDEIREHMSKIERLQLINDDLEDSIKAIKTKQQKEVQKVIAEKDMAIDELTAEKKRLLKELNEEKNQFKAHQRRSTILQTQFNDKLEKLRQKHEKQKEKNKKLKTKKKKITDSQNEEGEDVETDQRSNSQSNSQSSSDSDDSSSSSKSNKSGSVKE